MIAADIVELIDEYLFASHGALTDKQHLAKTERALRVLLSPDQLVRLNDLRVEEELKSIHARDVGSNAAWVRQFQMDTPRQRDTDASEGAPQ